MTTWRHLCGGEAAVVGCTAAVVDDVEYVATHARNGDVQLLANDWRHSECRNGRGFLQGGQTGFGPETYSSDEESKCVSKDF